MSGNPHYSFHRFGGADQPAHTGLGEIGSADPLRLQPGRRAGARETGESERLGQGEFIVVSTSIVGVHLPANVGLGKGRVGLTPQTGWVTGTPGSPLQARPKAPQKTKCLHVYRPQCSRGREEWRRKPE